MSTTCPPQAEPTAANHWAEQASRLADALEHGGWLELRTIHDLVLTDHETVYAELHATGWRYVGFDECEYERRALLIGGPFLMAITAGMSMIANRRRRRDAERHAAPQWRPLGDLRVGVTSCRLLVWHNGTWWSVWYAGITEVSCSPAGAHLDLSFADDHPYRFTGPQVPVLAVLVRHLARNPDPEPCAAAQARVP